MAYNEFLAERVHRFFTDNKVAFRIMKMMGGLCYMVNEKMCIGVIEEAVMARIGTEKYEAALLKEGCEEKIDSIRAMKGYVFLTEDATDMDADLAYWLQLALDFNPLAKASPKKKKKTK
ncbi:TfoX/Sxy family protein [Flavicella sediminum]|uniref:TfoX/Sxy family protein n=1 Tax=Flavicella sediminum TaxID=2585141 RepID=UPI00111EA506|nr:TfoX/Sxy family protein [Flavicella sediminum]